jgi:hypothetical protein
VYIGAAFLKFRTSGNARLDASWALHYLDRNSVSAYSELQCAMFETVELLCFDIMFVQVLEACG